MDTREILRIERDGDGLYSSNLSEDILDCYNELQHPDPFGDLKLMDGVYSSNLPAMCNWHFGFADMSQLVSWVGRHNLHKIYKHRGEVLKYTVPADLVHDGKQQIVFRKERAISIDIISPSVMLAVQDFEFTSTVGGVV